MIGRPAVAGTRRPLRILHVIPWVAPRLGGPSTLIGLARALAGLGTEVLVYTTDLDGRGWLKPFPYPPRLDVPVDRPLVEGNLTLRYFRTNWPSRYACSLDMARALVATVPAVDIVHIHSLYLFHGLMAAGLCRRLGVPYIIRPHGTLDPYHRAQRPWRKAIYGRLIENRNLRRAAAIHYTSTAEAAHAWAAGVRTPGFVLRQGVALDDGAPPVPAGLFRAARPNLADRKLIVFLGRITPKKGLDLLVSALPGVLRAHPDAHLVLAGPDDEGYGSRIRRLIAAANLEAAVTWTGLLVGQAKQALLADADVWVLPSRDENFGVAVIEALAAGAPVVITTAVGSHPEIARAGAGLVIEPEAAALGSALTRLLADRAERERLGARGRALVQERYSWSAVARDLNWVYGAIVANGGRLPRVVAGGPAPARGSGARLDPRPIAAVAGRGGGLR